VWRGILTGWSFRTVSSLRDDVGWSPKQVRFGTSVLFLGRGPPYARYTRYQLMAIGYRTGLPNLADFLGARQK